MIEWRRAVVWACLLLVPAMVAALAAHLAHLYGVAKLHQHTLQQPQLHQPRLDQLELHQPQHQTELHQPEQHQPRLHHPVPLNTNQALVGEATPAETDYQPEVEIEMLVAVLTAPRMESRRHDVRNGWSIPKTVGYKFMLCSDSKGNVSQTELDRFGDIMFLDCVEGYSHGLLTRKVAACLGAFVKHFPKARWLFKTDDDTYPKFNQILAVLRQHSGKHVYAGKLSAAGYPPDRNPHHKFYEPIDVFPDKGYARTAIGGPGYVLDAGLVRFIVDHGIPEKWVLWNEDQAVGIWVREATKLHVEVDYIYLPALNGYKYQSTVCGLTEGNLSKWIDNKMMMLHRVTLRQMECLSGKRHIEKASDCDC